jgi:hypothetical protein
LAVPGAAAAVTAKPLGAQTTRVSDRSLDEFVSASAGSDEAADSAPDGDDSGVAPSVPTMRWSADGDACDVCGAVVSRRWHDGGGFVCADCKAW